MASHRSPQSAPPLTRASLFRPPAPSSFSAATYTVAQGATEATLTVERSDATAPGIVTIHTDDGTALGIPPFSRYAFTLTRAVPAAVTATPDLAGTVALVAQ
ncbi:MAG: hypothetical protein ACOYMN_19645, partial [Roseimicrobium sp.]